MGTSTNTFLLYLGTVIILGGIGNTVAGELAIPSFTLKAWSTWSVLEGAIDIYVVPDEAAENVTAICTGTFGDGSHPVITNFSTTLFYSHAFSAAGTYNITVTCSNSINDQSSFHVIKIVSGDVPMSGMTAVIPGYILIGQPFDIKLSVTEGTNILYRIIAGNNDPVWVLTSGTETSTSQAYTLNEVGKVTVSVTATNEVSFSQSRPKSEVIYPVTGFTLTVTYSIVSFMEQVNFTLHIPESNVLSMGPLRYEIFDNKTSITTKVPITDTQPTSMIVLSTNLTLGEHVIDARVSSPLDEQDASVTLLSIAPITQFNASDIEFELDSLYTMNSTDLTSNVSITVIIPGIGANMAVPKGIEITWDFGDDSPTETEFIASVDKEHAYTRRGKYNITISTRLTGSTEVYSVTLPIRIGVLTVDVSPMLGRVLLDVFTFSISGAIGSEVNYLVDFGNGEQVEVNRTDVSEANITTISTMYKAPGIYQPRVFAWSESFAENIYIFYPVVAYLPVSAYNLSWTSQPTSRLPVLFEFSLTFVGPLPTNATCELDFGDPLGNKTIIEVRRPELQTTESVETSVETSTVEIVTEITSVAFTEMATSENTATDEVSNVTVDSNTVGSTATTTTPTPLGSSTALTMPEMTTFTVQNNYTQFRKFNVEVFCSNDVSNNSLQWVVLVTAGCGMATLSPLLSVFFVYIAFLYN